MANTKRARKSSKSVSRRGGGWRNIFRRSKVPSRVQPVEATFQNLQRVEKRYAAYDNTLKGIVSDGKFNENFKNAIRRVNKATKLYMDTEKDRALINKIKAVLTKALHDVNIQLGTGVFGTASGYWANGAWHSKDKVKTFLEGKKTLYEKLLNEINDKVDTAEENEAANAMRGFEQSSSYLRHDSNNPFNSSELAETSAAKTPARTSVDPFEGLGRPPNGQKPELGIIQSSTPARTSVDPFEGLEWSNGPRVAVGGRRTKKNKKSARR